MEDSQIFEKSDQNEGIDLTRKVLLGVVRNWYWLLLSIIFFVSIGFLFNRYSTSVYTVSSSIVKLSEEDNGLIFPLESRGSFFKTDASDIERQIRLIKSRKNINQTLDILKFDVSLYQVGDFKTGEIFPHSGFKVEINREESNHIPFETMFDVALNLESKTFRVSSSNNEIKFESLENKRFNLNEWFNINSCKLRLVIEDTFQYSKTDELIRFKLNVPVKLRETYFEKLDVFADENSDNIFHVSLFSSTPKKDLLFIKTFLEVARRNNLIEKNREANNSLDFIENQLAQLTDTLSYLQGEIDSYKIKNLDFGDATGSRLDRINGLDETKSKLLLEKYYFNYLEEYVRQKRNDEIFAPMVIGLEAPLLNDMVLEYIEVKKEAKLFANNKNNDNPFVKYEEKSVERLENSILENLKNLKAENQRRLEEIEQKTQFLIQSLRDLQKDQRDLYHVKQMSLLNEQLVQLFLQKKTEISISRSSNVSDYDLLDEARISNEPLKPQKVRNLIISIVLGLLIPLAYIFLRKNLTIESSIKMIFSDYLISHFWA